MLCTVTMKPFCFKSDCSKALSSLGQNKRSSLYHGEKCSLSFSINMYIHTHLYTVHVYIYTYIYIYRVHFLKMSGVGSSGSCKVFLWMNIST